jgi:hypothetical protein
MVGASTALYAISLAGVTAIQSNADRALIVRQSPAENATTRVGEGNDRLEASLSHAANAYTEAARQYDTLAPQLADMETSLEKLAGRVEAVSGAARALPGRVSLPTVHRSAPAAAARPATRASTGASGG